MKERIINQVIFSTGCFFVLLGAIGVVLPLLPTTPFLIVALACFSKSSPRFHQMLLDNRWVGPPLRDWEANKILRRKTKYQSTALILATFSISIFILSGRVELQLFLVGLASVLLFFIWRIKER